MSRGSGYMRDTDLDLADGEVEEGHALADLDRGLGRAAHAHGRAETAIELENGDLVEDGRVLGVRKIRV